MKTKEHILTTALDLFNQQGTSAVSTNHIAEAAGISPGNLYYHFRNKEEIIRALFERLFHEWDVTLTLPDDRLPTLEDAKGLVYANFEIMWQHRFMYRELIALLRADSTLHERYVAVRGRGYEGFRAVIALLTEHEVLNAPEDEDTVTRLADLCWLISEFWLATVEISGQSVSREQMARGVGLMMEVLGPYLPE